MKQPFWLPPSSFYFLVAGLAVATFFFVMGLLQDNGSEPETVTAGLIASGVLVAGVVLREFVLRSARERFIAKKNLLEGNLKRASAYLENDQPAKLTLETNAAAINNIRTRSEAAKVFDRIAQGHREVFELCAEYRRIVAAEMRDIHPNSPRLKALIKGNEYALKTHRFHLLRWAELESKKLAGKARNSENPSQRYEYTRNAREPLQLALGHYPDDEALKDSLTALDELLLSIKLKEFIDEAESAVRQGEFDAAHQIYQAALIYIGEQERSEIADRYRQQIEQADASL